MIFFSTVSKAILMKIIHCKIFRTKVLWWPYCEKDLLHSLKESHFQKHSLYLLLVGVISENHNDNVVETT